jgi:hypothetical protein
MFQRCTVVIRHEARSRGFEAGATWVTSGSAAGSQLRRLERLCLERCTERPDRTLAFDWVTVEPPTDFGPEDQELHPADLIAAALGELDPRGPRDEGGCLVAAEEFWSDLWDDLATEKGLSFHRSQASENHPDFLQGFVEGVIGTYWVLLHAFNEE